MMRVVDLFCGCGGLSLGFQKAGFEVVAAYDNWAAALKVYECNFELIGKLREMDGFMNPFVQQGLATQPMTMRDYFGNSLGLEYDVQTFPKDFQFVGSKTEVEQMIGNADPVNLAKFVANAIRKYLSDPHYQRTLEIDFDNWEQEKRLIHYVSEESPKKNYVTRKRIK